MATASLCVICLKPNKIWLDFLQNFTHYDVYMVVDDNSIDYKSEYKEYTKVNIVQVPDEECKKKGYIDMNFIIKKKVTGWEKAVYYFSTINTTYTNVWFVEDDVFIYNENTLLNIDTTYKSADLLTNVCSENLTGKSTVWHWTRIRIKLEPPFYRAMCCAIRVSKQLISKIRDYARVHKTLFFLEALFPTLCKYYKLEYDVPHELIDIDYHPNVIENIDKNHLYHPIKDIDRHRLYRNTNI